MERPGADLVLADGEEADQVERAVGSADEAVAGRLLQAVVGQEARLVLRRQGRDFRFQRRTERQHPQPRLFARLPEGGARGAFAGRIVVARVRDDEHRLLGQEAEAADALAVLVREFHVAQRLARLDGLLAALQDGQLGQPLLEAALDLLADLVDAALDFLEIGHRQVQEQRFQVRGRIQRLAFRVRVAVRLDDEREGVRFAEEGVERREPVALAGVGRERDVGERHLGGNVFLGVEEVAERGEPRVGDLDGAEAVAALGGEVGPFRRLDEGVENGGLARAARTDQIEKQCRHGVFLVGGWCTGGVDHNRAGNATHNGARAERRRTAVP